MQSRQKRSKRMKDIQDTFLSAVRSGNLDVVKKLVENKNLKIDLNHTDAEGMTAFLRAVQAGHCKIVNYLLTREDIEPTETTDGFSALHLAAANGHYQMVKLLLRPHRKLRIDVNLKVSAKNIVPLHFAAMNGNIPVVKLLLAAGADTRNKYNNRLTALDLAVQGGHHELSMIWDGFPQIMNTAISQRMKALGYHSNAEGICFGLAEVGMLAALDSEAALARFYETVFLVKRLKASELVAMKLEHENSIRQAEQQALTELKISKKSQLNELDKKQFRKLTLAYLHSARNRLTPEQLKREQQYTDILALFDGIELEHRGQEYLYLSAKPLLKKQIHNPTWVSPLIRPKGLHIKGGERQITMFTGAYSQDELCSYFKSLRKRLRENTAIKQTVVLALTSPGHAISIIYNPLEDSWKIINSDAMPSKAKELKKQTYYGDLKLTNNLSQGILSKGPYSLITTRIYSTKNCFKEVNSAITLWKQDLKPILTPSLEKIKFIDSAKSSWLSEAACTGDKKALKSLLHAGADVNRLNGEDKFSTLHDAVNTNRVKLVKLLLKIPHININHKKSDGNTALGAACCLGYTKVVRLLLHSKTIDVNIKNDDNISPLMYAAFKGYADIVDLLLKDPRILINLQGKHGSTALYIATQRGHYAVVDRLLKAKADTSIKAFDNCNLPMDAAIHYGHTDIVNLLLRHEQNKREFKKDNLETIHKDSLISTGFFKIPRRNPCPTVSNFFKNQFSNLLAHAVR